MKSFRTYIDIIAEANTSIDVSQVQQAAKVKAYQDAIAAGKSEEEAQNAEAAAGNLAGADALSKVNINDPKSYKAYTNLPKQGPKDEAERQEWMKDPTQSASNQGGKTGQNTPLTKGRTGTYDGKKVVYNGTEWEYAK